MKTQKEIAQFLKHHLETIKENKLQIEMDCVVSSFDEENNCGTVCCMAGWLPFTYPGRFNWGRFPGQSSYYVSDSVGRSALDGIKGIPKDLTDYLFGTIAFSTWDIKYRDYPYISLSSSSSEVFEAWEQVIADLEQEKFPL